MPTNKKKGKKKVKKSQSSGAAASSASSNPTSSGSFAIPPRSNDDIIKPSINGSPALKKQAIQELQHALDYEINSERHQAVISQIEKLSNDDHHSLDDAPPPKLPITYESPGMLDANITPLLYGKRAPFEIVKMVLPPCDVQIMKDEGMGQKDEFKRWPGGEALAMEFRTKKGKSSVNILLGECRVVGEDLWDYAVQYRSDRTKFVWPGYFANLQCPFCARLANPNPPAATGRTSGDKSSDVNDQDKSEPASTSTSSGTAAPKTYMMIIQMLIQITQKGMASRLLPRLCCKDCFETNLVENRFPWGARDRVMKYSILPFQLLPNAYDLSITFESTGMGAAVGDLTTKIMASGSVSDKFKGRVSKSKTKANRGQGVVKLKPLAQPTCHVCGLKSKELSSCGGCHKVFYCGRDCQKKDWKRHKLECGV